ncbi:MAG: ABC transporter ATP-binding protein [Thermomicrobiales bacterium]|nr:ABC transporter ATP-binding protein [Thermomicrobiales bacterium]
MSESETPILQFEQISKSYGNVPVLSGVDLTANAGELTVIYGPPASGKSVLMRILTGLEHATSGRILLRGEDITSVAPADRNIGYVPQSFALYPHLSVRKNISYPLDLAGVPASESREVVANAAAMLKIEEHLEKSPDQLSGGQKQRVAIARGIAKRTDFFVLDDPLAGLDFKLREQLVDDLRGLKTATGASVLYVTSDVIEAMTLADRMAVLSEGQIIETNQPEALYRTPQHAHTMALVGFPPANFLRGALERRGAQYWCTTPLFSFPADIGVPHAPRQVYVGLRPERIHLSHRLGDVGDDAGPLHASASVVLREDLGGEDIVYLQAQGVSLTMVDRDHHRGDDLHENVTLSVFPHHLTIFAADTGGALGRGAHGAAAAAIRAEAGAHHG